MLKQNYNPKICNHSVECILIGYAPNSKAYCCYKFQTHCIHKSWDVAFIESQDTVAHANPHTNDLVGKYELTQDDDEDSGCTYDIAHS